MSSYTQTLGTMAHVYTHIHINELHVYIYTCRKVCVCSSDEYVYMYICVCVYSCMVSRISFHTCTYLYVYVGRQQINKQHSYIYVYIHTCMYTYIHMEIHLRMFICIYVGRCKSCTIRGRGGQSPRRKPPHLPGSSLPRPQAEAPTSGRMAGALIASPNAWMFYVHTHIFICACIYRLLS